MVRNPIPRAERQDTARPAPVIRDFRRGGASFEIEWDVRTVYDFLVSLSDDAGAGDDLPAKDRRWLNDAREAFPEAVRADRKALLGNELCIQIAELVPEHPELTEPAAFVAAVEALDRQTAIRYLLADLYQEPATAELVAKAVDGDRPALDELERTLPEHRTVARLAVLRDPEDTLHG